jgi:hypothetical protein
MPHKLWPILQKEYYYENTGGALPAASIRPILTKL